MTRPAGVKATPRVLAMAAQTGSQGGERIPSRTDPACAARPTTRSTP